MRTAAQLCFIVAALGFIFRDRDVEGILAIQAMLLQQCAWALEDKR